MKLRVCYLLILVSIFSVSFAYKNLNQSDSVCAYFLASDVKIDLVNDCELRGINNDSIFFTTESDTLVRPLESVDFKLHNHTLGDIGFGLHYTVEQWTPDGWRRCKAKYSTVTNDIALGAAPGECYSFGLDLSNDLAYYPKGKFRLVKEIEIGKAKRQVCYIFYVKDK